MSVSSNSTSSISSEFKYGSSSTTSYTNSFGGRWSKLEDDRLRYAIENSEELLAGAKNPNWTRIAKMTFDGSRTATQCQSRWEKVLKQGLVKGPWTAEEDRIVIEMVSRYASVTPSKIRWSSIANNLPGRLGKQARERWYNHLDPALKKTAWTKDEDEKLIALQEKMGNKWSEIAKLLAGRSENNVKNRWNSHMRRLMKEEHERLEYLSLSQSYNKSRSPTKKSNSLTPRKRKTVGRPRGSKNKTPRKSRTTTTAAAAFALDAGSTVPTLANAPSRYSSRSRGGCPPPTLDLDGPEIGDECLNALLMLKTRSSGSMVSNTSGVGGVEEIEEMKSSMSLGLDMHSNNHQNSNNNSTSLVSASPSASTASTGVEDSGAISAEEVSTSIDQTAMMDAMGPEDRKELVLYHITELNRLCKGSKEAMNLNMFQNSSGIGMVTPSYRTMETQTETELIEKKAKA